MATLFNKFLYSGHPSSFANHLSISCGRYGKRYHCLDKRFLLLISPQCGMIQEKAIFLSLQEGFPKFAHQHHLKCFRPGYFCENMLIKLVSGVVP